MTFETLRQIHRLLKEEEELTRRAYKSRRDYLYEMQDAGAHKAVLDDAKEAMETADRIHTKALRALAEFEEHDWR